MKNNKNLFWSSLILSIVLVFSIGLFINTNAGLTPIYYNLTISEANTTTEVSCNNVVLTAGENKILENSVITIVSTADTGYTVDFLTVNGETFTNGGTFSVQTDIEIVSSASINTYDLTFWDHIWEKPTYSILCNGELIDFGTDVIKYGDTLNITASFDTTLWQIDDLYLTNGSPSSYNFVNNEIEIIVNGNVNIYGYLVPKVYDFNIEANNSTISIIVADDLDFRTEQTRGCVGIEYTMTATADSGYEITSITINGETFINGGNFTMPASDIDIVINTSLIPTTFDLTVISPNATVVITYNGDIITPGENVLNYLYDYDISATADTGYEIIGYYYGELFFVEMDNFPCGQSDVIITIETRQIGYDLSVVCHKSTISILRDSLSINAGYNVLFYGDILTITATANTGYEITSITINGETFINGGNFTMPASDINIVINTALIPSTYNLTTMGDNVTINLVSGETTITAGENVLTYGQTGILNIIANDGYQIDSILVNGVETANGTTITFTGNLTIEVVSSPIQYNFYCVLTDADVVITRNNVELIQSVDSVLYGDILTITATVNTGYTLTLLTVNDQPIENNQTIIVLGQTKILAAAFINTYDLTTTGDNATINLLQGETTITAGDNVLTYGQTATLNVIVSEGYQIDSILVNGVETANGATITFTENLTIEVVSSLVQTFDAIPEGMTFTLDNTTMTATVSGYNGSATEIVIPKTVSILNDVLCSGGDYLVVSIGAYAFDNNNLLTSIIIPDSVISIGDSAFSDCVNLISILIPNSVSTIGNSAFDYCSSLTSIIIPDSVVSISHYVFNGCAGLTSVTIFNSIVSFGQNSFGYCNNLTDIYYSGTESEWSSITNVGLIGLDQKDTSTITTIHYNYVA